VGSTKRKEEWTAREGKEVRRDGGGKKEGIKEFPCIDTPHLSPVRLLQ
jgi:hypothetical protein